MKKLQVDTELIDTTIKLLKAFNYPDNAREVQKLQKNHLNSRLNIRALKKKISEYKKIIEENNL